VVLAMLFPALARSGFGASIGDGDVVSLVTVLPTFALILGFTLSGGAPHPVLLEASLGTVALSTVALMLLGAVRAERLMTSSS
jgi:hypothetical protein